MSHMCHTHMHDMWRDMRIMSRTQMYVMRRGDVSVMSRTHIHVMWRGAMSIMSRAHMCVMLCVRAVELQSVELRAAKR